jgi:hypothetical protein
MNHSDIPDNDDITRNVGTCHVKHNDNANVASNVGISPVKPVKDKFAHYIVLTI